MDEINQDFLEENPMGTPQGGIIFPLLGNIALHGMHEICLNTYKQHLNKNRLRKTEASRVGFIRFADDFLIIHPSVEALQKMKDNLALFFKDIGLEFNEEKTRIVHTLDDYNGHKPEVTFLGFKMWQNRTKKHFVKRSLQQDTLFTFNVTPDPAKIKKHLSKIKYVIHLHRGKSQQELIKKLNPIIKGWSNYYSNHEQCREAFSYCDHITFKNLYSWAGKRHRNKGKTWTADRYFKTINGRKWRFCTMYLGVPHRILSLHVQDFSTYRKIPGKFSPFSKDSVKNLNYKFVSGLKTSLYKSQKGKCSLCGQPFFPEDYVEVHHLLPKNEPQRDKRQWLQLVHLICHDDLHRQIKAESEEEPDDA